MQRVARIAPVLRSLLLAAAFMAGAGLASAAEPAAQKRFPDLPIPSPSSGDVWQSQTLDMLAAVEKAKRPAAAPADIETMRGLIQLRREPVDGADIDGKWQLRSLQVTTSGVFIYDYFPARIFPEAKVTVFHKASGSQRRIGLLLPDGDRRFVFLGASYYSDEKPAQHSALLENPTADDRDRDSEGYLYKLAAGHLIMLFKPKKGRGEIYELRR